MYPVVKIKDLTKNTLLETTDLGSGSYSCSVTIDPNTDQTQKTLEFEVYLDDEATGSKVTVTQAAYVPPEPTYEVQNFTATPNTIGAEGGSVNMTLNLVEEGAG